MNVPEIRMKGFEEDWKKVSFDDLYEHCVQKNDLSFGVDKVISVANMYYNPDIIVSSEEYLRTFNIFQLGDIAFEGNKSKNFAHGRFVENTIGNGIVSHVFDVFRPKNSNYDLLYWKYAINNEAIMGRVLNRCTKASTMMHNLVPKDFYKEMIFVPSLDEQQSIGRFLNMLDCYIDSLSNKIATLKQLKAASLVSMFPQAGETKPRVRFKGFEGDWKTSKLGEVFTERIESNVEGEMLSVTMNNGIIKASENGRYDNSNSDKSHYKVVKVNDIAYNSMRMWQGASGCSSYEGIVSPAYTVVTPNSGIDAKFFAVLFKTPEAIKSFRLHSQGLTSDTWNLKFPAFSKIVVKYPYNVNEQEKIASFFLNLDKQISAQEQRLEKLKQIKSACLNKMFV